MRKEFRFPKWAIIVLIVLCIVAYIMTVIVANGVRAEGWPLF